MRCPICGFLSDPDEYHCPCCGQASDDLCADGGTTPGVLDELPVEIGVGD
jgi:hypothetical protein